MKAGFAGSDARMSSLAMQRWDRQVLFWGYGPIRLEIPKRTGQSWPLLGLAFVLSVLGQKGLQGDVPPGQ